MSPIPSNVNTSVYSLTVQIPSDHAIMKPFDPHYSMNEYKLPSQNANHDNITDIDKCGALFTR